MGGLKGEAGESPALSRNCKPLYAASQVAHLTAFATILAARRCGHDIEFYLGPCRFIFSARRGFSLRVLPCADSYSAIHVQHLGIFNFLTQFFPAGLIHRGLSVSLLLFQRLIRRIAE
jgi:hypothetical protein